MSLHLAIDAGGTKAVYVLGDHERELARVRGATLKRMRVSAEVASANLRAALTALQQHAGVSLRGVTSTCVGTAGNTVPLVTDWLRGELARHVGGTLEIVGDVEIALDAAFPGAAGVLVLAGTGSNVMGRAADGALFGAGGHGPVLADQGSGHRIGLRAVRAIFLAHDEGRPAALLPAVLAHWQLPSLDALVAYANTCAAAEFSPLAELVLACAQAGDALAAEVLAAEGRALAHLAVLVHRRLAAHDGAAWRPRFAFAGSIMQHVLPVRQALLAELRREIGNFEELPGVIDPVVGALWWARRAAREGSREW